jgi:hypothetical protein
MELKTQSLERLIQALSPTLSSELSRMVQETRESLEQEYNSRLETAVREAEAAAASGVQAQIESAVERAKEETRRQVAAEQEQQVNERVEAAISQFKQSAAEERARLETALTQHRLEAAAEQARFEAAKNEWSTELNKVDDAREHWRILAQVQRELAEAPSQKEILGRFLRITQPLAEGMALYLPKGDALVLWKSTGKGAFPETIGKNGSDSGAYFRVLSVRGQKVGAICASTVLRSEDLEFLAGSLEHAIEVFGLKLRAPVNKPAAVDR